MAVLPLAPLSTKSKELGTDEKKKDGQKEDFTNEGSLVEHLFVQTLHLEQEVLDLGDIHQKVWNLLVHLDLCDWFTDLPSFVKVDQVVVGGRKEIRISVLDEGQIGQVDTEVGNHLRKEVVSEWVHIQKKEERCSE